MICCCRHCSLIAVLFKPPTCKQSYHCSINQKTSIRTQKSSPSPGKSYKSVFLSHQDTMLYLWAVMAVCDLHHLSFVICCMMDTRCIILFYRGLLVQIFSSVLIIWQRNRQWRFSSALNNDEGLFVLYRPFDNEYVI